MGSGLAYLLRKFKKALNRLQESYALPKSDIVRDSCAKRFEFCVELAWKTLKLYLNEKHGVAVQSPKSGVREAYRLALIEYEELWLNMINWRNDLAHSYEESYIDVVYENLTQVIKLMNQLLVKLKADIYNITIWRNLIQKSLPVL